MTRQRRMSGFDDHGNGTQMQEFLPISFGHACPQHCPQSPAYGNEPLGTPLSIRDVARLIGCSAWTVRQRYMPMGLPHLRSGPQGKLLFFRDQIIRWILERQQKGGTRI